MQSPKSKFTIVFDGHSNSSSERPYKTGIDVIFSRKETADERIKGIIETTGNPKNMIVVSDDKEIKLFAKCMGARSFRVEEFINPKKHFKHPNEDSLKPELTYSSMRKINQELSKIWLK